MPYSRTNDMRNAPQGLSKYLPRREVRQMDSQTRFRDDSGLGRYIINQKEKTK